MKLSGRSVLATRGTSGIGLDIAEAFHGRGSTVIVCGRDKKRLAAVKGKFPRVADILDAILSGLPRYFKQEVTQLQTLNVNS